MILKSIYLSMAIFLLCPFSSNLNAQDKVVTQSVRMGAYYFDGWTGAYSFHISKTLKEKFKERESKWGWITSSQAVMDQQITLANNAKLSFFSFCWYYNGKDNFLDEPLNRSLSYFKSSNNKSLKFCLMIANHTGYNIKLSDWDRVSDEWINNFKVKEYLEVDKKPLIIFFSVENLIKNLEGIENVKRCLNELREKCRNNGLEGASIAVCLGPGPKEIGLAEKCDFDILTGYNYHSGALKKAVRVAPIDSMIVVEKRLWSRFPKLSKLKYIPVATLNWDPRAWTTNDVQFSKTQYFTGFSAKSVRKSVGNCKKWILDNSEFTTTERIGLLYAWNEYGEGGYLTPTKMHGNDLLNGVKKALEN